MATTTVLTPATNDTVTSQHLDLSTVTAINLLFTDSAISIFATLFSNEVKVTRYTTSVASVQARLVSGAQQRDHITPVLRSLHWLPVRRRIYFKTAVLVWKCIHGVAPISARSLRAGREVQGRSRLRSASTGCVDLPRVQTSVGQRSFTFHGPTVWNSLPSALCDSSLSLNTFKRRLKTHLFGQLSMPPGAVVAFCDSAPDINVMTYLLTYYTVLMS